jgi:hypothetical protein
MTALGEGQFGGVLNARLLRLGGAARSTLGSFARQKAPAQDDNILF